MTMTLGNQLRDLPAAQKIQSAWSTALRGRGFAVLLPENLAKPVAIDRLLEVLEKWL
ncbi:MAG: hypothetical protein V5B32_15295 [Candidatus Accumulibacter sp. UW26]|jgi:hypothetical protein